MGNVAGMLGMGGGAGGSGFDVDKAHVAEAVGLDQTNAAQQASLNALTQQQNFLNAVQAQNGLGNQSTVFNNLANTAAGVGPNPAQAMLANATGDNIANQAALMAGQRGAAANPALMARQAAMQGANIQQQSIGQNAALQANQRLGALGQMGNIANQQAAQYGAAVQGNTGANQNQQNMLLNQISSQNNANVSAQNSVNQANSQMAQANMGAQGNIFGNLLGAAGTVVGGIYGGPVGAGLGGKLGSAVGGGMQKGSASAFAEGGDVKPAVPAGPRSSVAQYLCNGGMMKMAEGGQVPAMVSPGEVYLPPKDVQKVAQGADPIATGEKIPGKPVYPGNDYRNDVVPKTLKEGGIVIPNEVLQKPNAHWEAMRFVHAVLKKNKLGQ